MAGLSGIVKKISDLVTGTPADDDCFIFGKTDLKKITLAKLKDALGITSINSALAKKEYELTSYNSDAITLINTICRKSGNVVSISGYFQSSKVISANVNFMHINPSIYPTEMTYFIISSNIEEAPNYAKMDSSGYVQFDVDAPAGYYFFNFGYIV